MAKLARIKLPRVITAIVIVVAVATIILLLLSVALTRKTVSESELKDIASKYAVSRCHADTSKKKTNGEFCNNLIVVVGDKQEDFAAVMWSAFARRADTNEIYSSFMISANHNNLAVDETTYVLNVRQ